MLIPCINRALFDLSQSDMDLLEHVSLLLYLSVLLQLDGLGSGKKKASKSFAKYFGKMSVLWNWFVRWKQLTFHMKYFAESFDSLKRTQNYRALHTLYNFWHTYSIYCNWKMCYLFLFPWCYFKCLSTYKHFQKSFANDKLTWKRRIWYESVKE